MQIEIGNFNSVKKTLKHFKMFSLNSMNSSDIIKAMENEDYGKVFPLNNLLNNSEVKEETKLETDFCKRNSSDHDSFQLYRKKVEVYTVRAPLLPAVCILFPHFLKSKNIFSRGFFLKVWPYVWLVFQSGF